MTAKLNNISEGSQTSIRI